MITQPPIKMKPCPVCEHRAELTDDSDGYETPTFYVNCACDAGACLLGPNRPTAEEAIAEWNDLSDAMQVFQMAKRIGNDWWIANKGGWEIGGARDDEYGSGDTLAAALLKLAKNIQAGEK